MELVPAWGGSRGPSSLRPAPARGLPAGWAAVLRRLLLRPLLLGEGAGSAASPGGWSEAVPAPAIAADPDRDPDGELLAAVLEEYPHATRRFAEMVARHWSRVRSICQAVLLHEHDAEEATQDTFLKVHRYLPSFRRESRFATWMNRIARNTALNLLASRQRERRARERASRDPTLAVWWHPWKSADPAERHLDLRDGLARLDPDDRLVLVLRELEGMAYEEVAEALEIGPGAARMRALRARERLRAVLARAERKAS